MISQTLADWAHDLTVGDLPDAVRHATARHLLDGIGNAVAAQRLGQGRAGWSVADSLGGPPEARPLTSTRLLSAPAAGMATAVLVHALDFDDTHAGALVHATAVSLPAAFAVGQQVRATGAQVLTAAAIGLETACRLGLASPHGFHSRGLHATAVVGPLASALVAGRSAALTTHELVNALGIAGSSSSGTTGAGTTQVVEYSLKLDSNPEFTSSVLVAYARAAFRLNQQGSIGAKTVFDVAPGLLSPKPAADLRKALL